MNSAKTWLVVLLGLTTLGGGILAWRQHSELSGLRAAAMSRNERAEMQKRLWELEKANREMKDRAAAGSDRSATVAPSTADHAANGADGRVPGRGEPRREPDPQLKAMREMLNKPGVQGMITAKQKVAIDARYAALFRNLNLPADQTEKLKGLLAERTTTMLDVLSVASDQGIDPRDNPAGFRQLVASTQDEINKSIKSLIGEPGFAQLSNFEQTMPQRNLVGELQQRLSYSSTPLTNAQADQLVQILAANPSPRPLPSAPANNAPVPAANSAGGAPTRGIDVGGMLTGLVGGALSAGGPDAGRGGPIVTSAAVAQSQTILAPPQVAALQQIQQQQQTQQQLRQLWTDTLTASQPPSPASGAPANSPAIGRKGGKQ